MRCFRNVKCGSGTLKQFAKQLQECTEIRSQALGQSKVLTRASLPVYSVPPLLTNFALRLSRTTLCSSRSCTAHSCLAKGSDNCFGSPVAKRCVNSASSQSCPCVLNLSDAPSPAISLPTDSKDGCRRPRPSHMDTRASARLQKVTGLVFRACVVALFCSSLTRDSARVKPHRRL